MDKDLLSYYEARFEMMSSQGWQQLLEDVDVMITRYNTLMDVSNSDQLFYKKGQLDILHWLTNLKRTSEEAYEELNNA